MKIILAPDKFKGSLTGLEFCKAAEEGIKEIIPNTSIIWLPLADGGDGTIEVVDFYLHSKPLIVEVNNPFFQSIKASYLYASATKTAFIEMAEASGMKLLSPEEYDCIHATTLGTGEMILDALSEGATKIILGIGGSATNDCGIGMATALGFRFLDEDGDPVKPIGKNLSRIRTIDDTKVDPRLQQVNFEIACDVTNPLYGPIGAAYTYAGQKGASNEDIQLLDEGLRKFAMLIDRHFNIDSQRIEGAGAAGGIGIATKVFLNGTLSPGIELIKNLADFNHQIKDADWIITGEGKLDIQTLSGKTIQGVVASAKSKNLKVAALCGAIGLDEKTIKEFGIQYHDAVMSYAKNLDDALLNASKYVKEMAKLFAKNL